MTALVVVSLPSISSTEASANLPSTNLLFDLRANNSSSYSGSGSTWTDMSGNGRTATMR